MEKLELKPVRCGCGGEAVLETDHDTIQPVAPIDWKRVRCNKCNIRTTWRKSEAEAITTWNRAMGATDMNVGDKERTAKVVDPWKVAGYDELNAWCPECEHRITRGCSYCPTCGVKLDWSGNE